MGDGRGEGPSRSQPEVRPVGEEGETISESIEERLCRCLLVDGFGAGIWVERGGVRCEGEGMVRERGAIERPCAAEPGVASVRVIVGEEGAGGVSGGGKASSTSKESLADLAAGGSDS